MDAADWSFEEAEDLLVVSENLLEPVQIELGGVEVEWLSARQLADPMPDLHADAVVLDDAEPIDDEPLEDDLVGQDVLGYDAPDDLEAEWDVRVVDDPSIEAALADIVESRTWRSWFCTQDARPGIVRLVIEDDVESGLSEAGPPQAREYRYLVPAQRFIDAADRRAELRAALAETWTAVADRIGWKSPPPDPGPR